MQVYLIPIITIEWKVEKKLNRPIEHRFLKFSMNLYILTIEKLWNFWNVYYNVNKPLK